MLGKFFWLLCQSSEITLTLIKRKSCLHAIKVFQSVFDWIDWVELLQLNNFINRPVDMHPLALIYHLAAEV